jgi:hypothetical protein
MGPANHAPGVPIMGRASSGPYLMGGADAGPHVNVIRSGDRGQRVDVFGDSDLRFVDSLFTPVRRRPLTQPANEHEPHVSLRPRGGLGVRDATTY